MFTFKVTKQFGRGPEILVAGFTKTEKDTAIRFIQDELAHSAYLNQQVIYRLDDGITKQEFDSSKSQEASTSSGSQQGSRQSFSPSPMSTTPRAPGTPQKWWKDEEDDTKK